MLRTQLLARVNNVMLALFAGAFVEDDMRCENAIRQGESIALVSQLVQEELHV